MQSGAPPSRRRATRSLAHAAATLLVALAAAPIALAQPVAPSPPLSPSVDPLDSALAERLDNPGEPAAAVRYARLAAERGQGRAAIAALEQVLRLDPSLDNIRLELASLHLTAGSADLAATYARQALQSPEIPPAVAERARRLLAEAERGSARSLLDVTLFAGTRYDTNANEATALGTVGVFSPFAGSIVDITPDVRGRSDWSAVFSGQLAHRQDLGLQREGTWETNLAAFEQRFARIARVYDLSVLSLDTGPRIGVAEFGSGGNVAQLALRPYFSATWIGYGGETYSWLYGGGLTAELRLPPRWTAELSLLGRFGNYENTDFRPRARDYTGREGNLVGAATYAVSAGTRVTAALSYTAAGARQSYYDREGYGAALSFQTLMPVTASYEVGLSARAGVRRLSFNGPDPQINPDRRRRDTRWSTGVSLILPVAGSVAVMLEYDWYDQTSTYGFYRYNNHAVTFGVRVAL